MVKMGDHKDPADLCTEPLSLPMDGSSANHPEGGKKTLANGDSTEPEMGQPGEGPRPETLARRRQSVTFSDALGIKEFSVEEIEGAYTNGEDSADMAIARHRMIFRAEMLRLNAELEAFRRQCREEMVRYAKDVERQKAELQSQLDALAVKQKSEEEIRSVKDDLADLASEKDMLLRRQAVIDAQAEVIGREEELARRQKGLEDYEKEIIGIERYLDKRYTVAKEKEKDIQTLDEELRTLAGELKTQKDELQNHRNPADLSREDPESAQTRDREEREQEARHKEMTARKNRDISNWDFLRKSLMDKQVTLESALRRLKFDLTTEEGRNTDLSLRVTYLESELHKKDKKVKELETQLSLTIGQMRAQEDGRVSPQRTLLKPSLMTNGDLSLGGSTLTLSVQSAHQGSVIEQPHDRPRSLNRLSLAAPQPRRKPSTRSLHKPDTWVEQRHLRRSNSERDRKLTESPPPPARRSHSRVTNPSISGSATPSRKPSQTCSIM